MSEAIDVKPVNFQGDRAVEIHIGDDHYMVCSERVMENEMFWFVDTLKENLMRAFRAGRESQSLETLRAYTADEEPKIVRKEFAELAVDRLPMNPTKRELDSWVAHNFLQIDEWGVCSEDGNMSSYAASTLREPWTFEEAKENRTSEMPCVRPEFDSENVEDDYMVLEKVRKKLNKGFVEAFEQELNRMMNDDKFSFYSYRPGMYTKAYYKAQLRFRF